MKHSRMYERMQWAAKGDPQPPMQRCARGELRDGYVCSDAREIARIEHDLNRINGNEYVILYDWATTGNAMMPGHHIYRVASHGGVDSEDQLVLCMSLQERTDQIWPTGNPRKPGPWVVDAFRAFNAPQQDAIEFHDARMGKLRHAKGEREAHGMREIGRGVRSGLGRRLARKARSIAGRTPRTQVATP